MPQRRFQAKSVWRKLPPGNAGGGNLSGWIRCARISRLRRPGRLKYPHPSVVKTRRREQSAGRAFSREFVIGCHSTRCYTSRRLPFFRMERAYFVLARAKKKRYTFLCSPPRVLAEELCAVMPDTAANCISSLGFFSLQHWAEPALYVFFQ